MTLSNMGKAAKLASRKLATAPTKQKNLAIELLAQFLIQEKQIILEANAIDLTEAHKTHMNEALLDRLNLQKVLESMSQDLLKVAQLPDPVGEVFESNILPNGMELYKQRTPIGVIGVIYESRPNVTTDIAGLTIKTGNAVILRGGSETLHTNLALVKIIQKSLAESGLPRDAVQFIDNPDRNYIKEMLHAHEFIDLIIPRGGANLHHYCREHSTIPVITGGIGICHLFVDESADQTASLEVIHNAKIQKPSACNALDTILVHEKIAEIFIPKILKRFEQDEVTFVLSPEAFKFITETSTKHRLATENDWDIEWLSLIAGIRVVKNIDEAIDHIQQHSLGHSDGILTESQTNAEKFVNDVDSACVYVNASTRFSDGAQFGLGAEVAISTQKIHARGPMALRELTSYKWVGLGHYHTRR